ALSSSVLMIDFVFDASSSSVGVVILSAARELSTSSFFLCGDLITPLVLVSVRKLRLGAVKGDVIDDGCCCCFVGEKISVFPLSLSKILLFLSDGVITLTLLSDSVHEGTVNAVEEEEEANDEVKSEEVAVSNIEEEVVEEVEVVVVVVEEEEGVVSKEIV